MPTCWDEWFPEVARMYSLGGAEMIVYPTAIGSEPGHPDFDTQPLWQQVIVGNGISNGTFMIAPNRYGDEGRSPSTARRSSPIRTAAYWFRHRATRPLYSSPTSISISDATGSPVSVLGHASSRHLRPFDRTGRSRRPSVPRGRISTMTLDTGPGGCPPSTNRTNEHG
jgi:hypothetical protein